MTLMAGASPHAPRRAWGEVAESEDLPDNRGGLLARLAPPVIIAALLALLGVVSLAVVVLVLGSALAVLSLWSPRFARAFDRLVHFVAHWAGLVLTVVLLGLFEVFVIAPVSFVAWILRRDLLASFPRPSGNAGWRVRPGDDIDLVDRPFGQEALAELGPVARAFVVVPRVVGWIGIVLVLDLLVGTVTQRPATELATDARMQAATADAPWFDDYVEELVAVEYQPAAFVLSEPVDHQGEFINVVDGRRVTVEPAGVPADAPTVWIFGGSPAWGEGQRDAYTIASQLARYAAEGGTPVHVVNRAQRGDSAFVAAQRLERALAHEPAPDLVLFLDGPDDLNIQAEHVTGNPSHHGLDAAAAEVEGDNRQWWERYRDTSALFAVGQQIHELIATAPAWAQAPTDQYQADRIAAAVADVYDRSRHMADIVAGFHGVDVRYYWLPVASTRNRNSIYLEAARRLETDVTVLEALDEGAGPVFLDAVHTNEEGARQTAALLHESLQPILSGLGT